MNVNLGKLKVGQWRELSAEELNQINIMIATSSKTEEASKDIRKKKSSFKRNSKFNSKRKKRT
jgi:23S rRNA pseudouridine2604 synthase